MRLHSKKGANITLVGQQKFKARRNRSFANAIVFSSRPLERGETFLFEINCAEPGWAGHLRCGITLLNPQNTVVPPYLLPDFANLGNSWVYAIKPSQDKPFGDDLNNFSLCESSYDIPKCQDVLCDVSPKLLSVDNSLLPTDVGSRIGIFVSDERKLYFLLNGIQYGPCADNIPIEKAFIYAVVDLYGTTKEIRVIQSRVTSLKNICAEVLRSSMTDSQISKCALPQFMKDYVLMLCPARSQ